MGGSAATRRVSELVGVALFAVALIWIIALASYDQNDPAWFFSTGAHAATVNNFAGRVGAFLAELSFQLFGYASYSIPALLVIIGWNHFWCRSFQAAGTKITGATMFVGSLSALLSLIFGNLEVSGKTFRAGGYAGDWLARLTSEYFNRTGSVIVILTLIFLATIVSTQFSFGRLFAALCRSAAAGGRRGFESFREWREERRREKQRREVIAKHTKKGAALPDARAVPSTAVAEGQSRRSKLLPPAARDNADEERSGSSPASTTAGPRSFAPPRPPRVSMPAPPLPLPDAESTARAPAERRKGEYVLPPVALLDAPKTERKIDERDLMDGARLLEEKCREFAVEGAVTQIHPGPVVTTFEFKPDAGVKYAEDHQSVRRPVPRDAGRVGADRPDPGQVHGRHSDSKRHARADLAARASRVGGLSPLPVQADARAGQDDSWRACTLPISRRCRIC